MIPRYATNIPAELRALDQWAVADEQKAPRKVDGRRASVTNPGTWTDFETALRRAVEIGSFPGFMLSRHDPFSIVYFDVRSDTPQE